MFSKVDLRLPLSSFEKGVLTELNVVPTQLHPNNWAFIQAFHILCTHIQVRLWCPSADISEADASKVVVDGCLVDE